METKVDVLAVMDRDRCDAGYYRFAEKEPVTSDARAALIEEAKQARAAVADLIAAARLTVGLRAYTDRHDVVVPLEQQAPDIAALLRALARITPAAQESEP
jgi:small ligand-binding sensory domain FIST